MRECFRIDFGSSNVKIFEQVRSSGISRLILERYTDEHCVRR